MEKSEFKPNCRYGHGDLEKEASLWALSGVNILRVSLSETNPPPGKAPQQMNLQASVAQNSKAYSVNVFRCPVCGYVELFDDEVKHG